MANDDAPKAGSMEIGRRDMLKAAIAGAAVAGVAVADAGSAQADTGPPMPVNPYGGGPGTGCPLRRQVDADQLDLTSTIGPPPSLRIPGASQSAGRGGSHSGVAGGAGAVAAA